MKNNDSLACRIAEPGSVLVSLPGDGAIRKFGLFQAPDAILTAYTADAVEPVFTALEEWLAHGGHAAGFVAYEAAPAFDPAMRVAGSDDFPLVCFGCFRNPPVAVSLPHVNDYGLPEDFIPELDSDQYAAQYAEVLEEIIAGSIYQANLTFRCRTGPELCPERLFLNLWTRQPVPCAAYLNLLPDSKILSLSPELYLESSDGRQIVSAPMKGTAPRAPSAALDRATARGLAGDPKNMAENLMIADMVRNDLGRIALPGSVAVDALFRVETYRTVHQMSSVIRGKLPEALPLFELFRATFPPASITGAPKIAAMAVLAALERTPRRIYTGAIGCVFPDRRLRFNVAIRTLTCYSDRTETGVGGGIVYDSRPEAEWQEALLKCRYATVAMPEFEVFETLGWTAAGGFSQLAEHVERARLSQEYFLRPYRPGSIESALENTLVELNRNPLYRTGACVKFRLRRDGPVEVDLTVPRRPDWRETPLRLLLSRHRISATDVFRHHKTTCREIYDSALAAARAAGFHEVIFRNEHDEVTEGAISSLFIHRDGRWRTPRLECGLLPGIWRAQQLAALDAEECILHRDDLLAADEIRVGNSLRGAGRAAAVVDEASGLECR